MSAERGGTRMAGAVRDCRTARVIERCTVHDAKEVAREAIDQQEGPRVSGALSRGERSGCENVRHA